MNITIRRATEYDVGQVSELAATSFGGAITDVTRIERYYRNLLNDGGIMAVAETDGPPLKTVGLITCSKGQVNGQPKSIQTSLSSLDDFWSIGELAVDCDYRKQRIGSRLLAAIQTMVAQQPDAPKTLEATCWVNGGADQSINLFLRDGFEKVIQFNDDPQCCSRYPDCGCTHWLVVKHLTPTTESEPFSWIGKGSGPRNSSDPEQIDAIMAKGFGRGN